MSSLLVTGGAGFIGSNFVLGHVLKHPSDTVVVLDKLTYAGNRTHLAAAEDTVTFIEGDIADREKLQLIVNEYQINTIVNFAAETHVDNSIADAWPFLHSNVLGVQSIIEVLKEHRGLKLLHVSTDEVYGDIGDTDPACKVGDPLLPSSPYAASKASAEMLLMAAMRTHRVPVCVSRCTNNYGPHQASEKFLPTVIRCALNNQPIPLYGDGNNKRDWLYVTDHCDALELLLKTEWAFWDDALQSTNPNDPAGGRHIFNIGADDERTNLETAKAVLDALGKPHDFIEFVPDRPGHDWRYAVDSSPIRKLGWEPKVPFTEGLTKMIEWYKK